ncbi:eukaryotic translation initiation factor 2 subunit 2 isoform X1 [Vespa velutina]|uniref:eukaryotic translation initiation factor 2 subunit 2 isoform X2 n=1 Tax=Vespula pensylvanica TaxID=30213 RepID=UPI001CBA1566|nr:eukaryotic translation initiation factor 2 subunit 2 isoform X2 [Vespula pensylvanica]XP_046816702.1 eukaryotic translation initiation factor 2 subunit 2 isoform X1 [Vespa crabro]XP_047345486.1 eukaryotic translation initiation factor 2 subunit 2 isoform X1 [Vespa velutina]XP_050846382.1 eukaryotic translation initiation factor 2 subunit 2 isoform X2 [Vespula vulgaris]
MTEEDSIFDPSLKKKKKKKRGVFDIDGEFNEAGSTGDANEMTGDKENQEPEPLMAEDDETLDLENFGKKKKKKKKAFNLNDLDAALPDAKKEDVMEPPVEETAVDDNLDLDMDFSKTKKKKKKKKDLDELVAEEERKEIEDKENGCTESERSAEYVEETSLWVGSDRDYTYDELLVRVFNIMREKNPDMVAGKKQKFVMRPPQVVRIGTKKTSFANFTEICKTLHRQPKHLLDFLLAELGTSGSVDGNSQLIIKGRFQQKQIENVLRRYIKEYVTCHTCRSPDTILQKDTRLFFLQCETCGSRCSVASIKSGFQAVTGKRAAIRAKTA